jgi:hypothetical protein
MYAIGPALMAQEAGQPAQGTLGTPGKEDAAEDQPSMMQCPMMAGMRGIQMYSDGPVMLLARAKELGLSNEQKEKLHEIEKSARAKARSLLTDEQRGQLKDLPQKRLSMMELSRLQMKKMMATKQADGMCPMCMKMMQQTEENSGADHHQPEEK